MLGQVLGLLGADARGQAVLPGLDELAHDALDPLGRLALAEDHLGEAAALAAVQIDVGEAQVGVLYLRGRWEARREGGEGGQHLRSARIISCALGAGADPAPHRGEFDKADKELRWFVRTYTKRANKDKEITDPDELLLSALAGCESGPG